MCRSPVARRIDQRWRPIRRADAADDASGLGERVQALEAEVQTLRAQLAHLCQQLGVEPMSQP